MSKRVLTAFLLLMTGPVTRSNDLPPAAAIEVSFEQHIRPIFEAHCLDCHGESAQESNLRLDRKSSLIHGGDSGEPAIVEGQSAESHLVRLVAGIDPKLTMPPDGAERLSPEQIGLIRAWIDQQAPWPGPDGVVTRSKVTSDHWSFQPLRPVAVPERNDPRVRNPIDAFILQRLNEQQLSPGPEADRRTLIRRIFLDVLGLPPTPKQVRQFVESDSPAATESLIDDVLESPHFGERWARHWLDLVRFAETHGFETNRERPGAWRYRDYVIESLNSDKPYDQFIREQLAGDLNGTPIALGYLVAGPYDLVKSPDINLTRMQRQNELDDMISTTGTAFLGLTIGCARCHNHKFDPLTQTDYYRLQAVFSGVNHGETALPLSPQRMEQLAAADHAIELLRQQLADYQRPSGTVPSRPTDEAAAASGTDPREPPTLRPPVTATGNVETFEPVTARSVRFTIEATNSGEPCLDELEVFSGDTNVALASTGSVATASGTLPGYAIHKLEHINDGRPGNRFSWISTEVGAGWVQIDFPQSHRIDRIAWARDREGQYQDRLATIYRIECSEDGQTWKTIASAVDRLPFSPPAATQKPVWHFDHLSKDAAAEARRLVADLEKREAERSELAQAEQAYAGQFAQPGPTHRLYRGEPSSPREAVAPGVPEVLTSLVLPIDAPEPERRRMLADWIASPDNPLTARVIVNRVWQYHFGQGLVTTPSDFGAGGVPPTHPQLLDWLAGELIAHGWSLKHLHRLILNSRTYQQSGFPREEGLRRDAATQYLWRYPPHRLEAEPIRDSILAVSGVLNLERGGPGFSAFEVEAENVRHYHPKTAWGPDEWRRMIYMTKVRMEQDAVFGLFDCPDAATSVPKRTNSTTPLQALNLFNSQFLLQQAGLFAERLEQEAPEDPEARIRRAFQLCYARDPADSELRLSSELIQQHGLPAFCRALFNSNEFLFVP